MTSYNAQPAATVSPSDPANTEVAALANGNFVAAWNTPEGAVNAQMFDQSGQRIGSPIWIASTGTPTGVAGLTDGGFVVELQVGSDLATRTVSTQRVDAAGQLAGGQILQSSTGVAQPNGTLGGLGVLPAPDGGYYASLVQDMPATKGYGAHQKLVVNKVEPGGTSARWFASDVSFALPFATAVAPDGDLILVRADGAPFFTAWSSDGTQSHGGGIRIEGTTGNEDLLGGPIDAAPSAVSATFLADGNLLLVWQAGPGASVGENQLQGQLFDPDVHQQVDGSYSLSPPVSPLLTFAGAVGSTPKVTPLASGGFLLSWSGNSAQAFDANGQPTSGVMQIASQDIAPTPEGGFVVMIDDGSNLGAQTYTPEPDSSSDATPPAAIDFFPAAGSSMLPPDWNLAITFDEDVQAGSGTITLQTADGQVVQTFATASDPGIRFNGSSVIIDPATDLQPGTAYTLTVSADAVVDLAGNAYAGVSGYGFTTAGAAQPPASGDTTAPAAIDFYPAAGSSMLPPDWSLAITFDEDVQAGSGSITLQTAAGAVVQTFATATDAGIHFNGRSITIDPAADLQPGTTYTMIVDAGAVVDLAGNAYAGVSGYSFTTAGTAQPPASGDTTAPAAIDFFPAADSHMLPPEWSLGITFDEEVQAGSGTITLRTAAGQVVQTFAAASDPGIRFNGASVIIDPAADLQPGTRYELLVSGYAVVDLAGNAYAGLSGYSFTTAGTTPAPGGDTTAPAAIDFFPAAGSAMLPPDWSLGITFDEDVQAGSGTITLRTAAGELVQTFAAAGDPGIRFNGASVIIDPAADLQPGTTYDLVVSGDAVVDLVGNPYAGVSGYSFTTAG